MVTSSSTLLATETNYGALINEEIYRGINKIMERSSSSDDGNELPENAIVGSDSLNDTIKGSYRRERILGKDGDDILNGMEADDRLEGGTGEDLLDGGKDNDRLQGDEGNDFLDGGEGDTDVAIFSDDFENYDYSISEDGEIITISHTGGTQTDGVDTLRNLEFGQFGGNSNPDLSGPPRIIPLTFHGISETPSRTGFPPKAYFQ